VPPPARDGAQGICHPFELASERTISSTCIYADRGRHGITSLTRQDFGGTTEIQKEIIGRSLGL
jgi:hypothetical protein